MNAYEISCAQSLPVGKDCACSSTSATVHRVAAPHGGTDMFESLSTGALVLSAHNRLLRMNAAAEAMLGFSARNNIGVALADIVLDARKLELGRGHLAVEAFLEREERRVDRIFELELVVVPYAVIILVKGANSAIVYRVRLKRDVWIGRGCT